MNTISPLISKINAIPFTSSRFLSWNRKATIIPQNKHLITQVLHLNPFTPLSSNNHSAMIYRHCEIGGCQCDHLHVCQSLSIALVEDQSIELSHPCLSMFTYWSNIRIKKDETYIIHQNKLSCLICGLCRIVHICSYWVWVPSSLWFLPFNGYIISVTSQLVSVTSKLKIDHHIVSCWVNELKFSN